MNGTTEVVVPIVVCIVGTGIGIVGVLGFMLHILTMNVTTQFEANAAQMTGMKADLSTRIDETNRRIDDVKTDLGRRIDETNKRIDDTSGSGRSRAWRARCTRGSTAFTGNWARTVSAWRNSKVPSTASWRAAATGPRPESRSDRPRLIALNSSLLYARGVEVTFPLPGALSGSAPPTPRSRPTPRLSGGRAR